MGLFDKKAASQPAAVNEPAPPSVPFEEIGCIVCVSLDGKKHSLESEGFVRFYENEMSVSAPGDLVTGGKSFFKVFVFGLPDRSMVEHLRFPYTEISRAYFPAKRYIRLELKDGRYAFLLLNGKKRDEMISKFASHGITVEPFSK